MEGKLNPEEFETHCRPVKGRKVFKVLHKPTGISAESTADTLKEAKATAVKALFKAINALDYKNSQKDASLFDDIDEGLKEKFKAYHEANPQVYKEFKSMSFAMRSIRDKYSHSSIIEVLRWNIDIKEGGEAFYINNAYKAMYARLLIYNHPEFEGFFELRKMKSSPGRLSDEESYRSKETNTL
jgi:hypothetical protein